MMHHQSEPFGKTHIFRVSSPKRGHFEVRTDDDELLGSSSDEIKAIWSAVLAADLVSERGYRVRVLVKRGDAFVEEYVAKPQRRDPRLTEPGAQSGKVEAVGAPSSVDCATIQ